VLKGEGNFSLLKEPHPLPAEDWKVYDGASEFLPGDVAAFAGAKRFQFNAVPLVPGDERLSFGFSYFDPEKGEYRSVRSTPQAVTVTGEIAKPAKVVEATEPEKSEPEGPQLAPLRTELGRVRSYQTIAQRAWFMPVIGGLIALTVVVFGFGWWMNRGVDHAKVARLANEAATREALSKAERAVNEGDGVAFFMAAREAIRIRVAERTGIRSEAVTSADLKGLDDPDVLEILEEADRIDYSGTTESLGELKLWKGKLDSGLNNFAMEGGRKAA